MSFAKVHSAQTTLLDANIIDVEVDLSGGLYSFSVVGLSDKAVEEARDRVSSAIKNSGFKSPKAKNQKVVISLAPADTKKEGSNFDLAIALGYLLASKDIAFSPSKKLFVGELALDGNIRSISGTLPIVRAAKEKGFSEVYVPIENAQEAALVENITIFPTASLETVVAHLNTKLAATTPIKPQPKTKIPDTERESLVELSDIKGQETAKRGLEIAAAGGHNIALYGPPGTGKTMLARAFAALLPPLSLEEMLEVTAIHSISGILKGHIVTEPPFRSPHHTASHVSIVGGGTIPKPGEITLAHRGVLFLDEFPEFERRVIEALRQPLEDRVVSITRAKGSAIYPAQFVLVAAMNPCPCGNYGSKKECVCTPTQLLRYRRKISGPIIDRVDMWVEVGPIEYKTLSGDTVRGEESGAVRARIQEARTLQQKRFANLSLSYRANSEIGARDIDTLIPLKNSAREILNQSATKLGLSGRAYHRVLKLARTIADLEGSAEVAESHLMEALSYRPKQVSGL